MRENGGDFELKIAFKRSNFPLALDEESNCGTLDTTGTLAPRDFLPDNWTQFKPNDTVSVAADARSLALQSEPALSRVTVRRLGA